jgi:hypothetical protein
MLCYNVGDSYTCAENYPWCPNSKDHYWYRIAQDVYNCSEIVNDSLPGRSNSAIFRAVMKHCLENPNIPAIYFINVTSIFRIDLSDPNSDTLHKILTPKAITNIDFETIECTLYLQLIGLIEFLKFRNKPFLIFNNNKNFSSDQLPKRDAFVEYIKNEPRVVNWFNNARIAFHENISKIKPVDYDQYQWNGHDGTEGHKAYLEMLLTRLPY